MFNKKWICWKKEFWRFKEFSENTHLICCRIFVLPLSLHYQKKWKGKIYFFSSTVVYMVAHVIWIYCPSWKTEITIFTYINRFLLAARHSDKYTYNTSLNRTIHTFLRLHLQASHSLAIKIKAIFSTEFHPSYLSLH